MFKWFSLSNISAGFVAVLVGFTSSAVIVFQAAAAAGATPEDFSSWLFALGLGMGLSTIGLSLYYRMPILTAWSTPGAALLVSSLSGFTLPEAIGAFMFTALFTFISGVTGWFEKVMTRIPRSLASAMLAGILLQFGLNIFVAMPHQPLLVITLFLTYLIGRHLFPRYVIIFVLSLGIVLARYMGLFNLNDFHVAFSTPHFIMPQFSLSALISVSIPLYVVTMTSQNIPGIAVFQAEGYKPPISSLISWTGFTTLLLAPFGGYSFNLAAVTAAICMGPQAERDPSKRYRATVWGGIFYLLTGIFGATVAALLFTFPKELVLAVAGLALLNTIGNSLKVALKEEVNREPALITFLLSASGISLWGVGAAFWALLAGGLGYVINSTILSLREPTRVPSS
ncbi:MAG: benzoate/H(+) symporter BenE family transporter [Tatlockia sp.]|jgi:benzoate membrane transport protein